MLSRFSRSSRAAIFRLAVIRAATTTTITSTTSFFSSSSFATSTAKKNPLDFTGKVAIITGGASGIGRAASIGFAEAGAKVVVADLNEVEGAKVVEGIKKNGGEAVFVRTNVSDDKAQENLVNMTLKTYGRLDVAFNNAGCVHDTHAVADIPTNIWDKVIAVNLSSVYYAMRHQIPAMIKQGNGGSIINTASIGGLSSTSQLGAYIAAKHGVVGLTRAAAHDHAKDHIRVNALAPGGVSTNIVAGNTFTPAAMSEMTMNAMKRQGAPEELVGTVLMLASPASSFTTGAVVVVDGGHVNKF